MNQYSEKLMENFRHPKNVGKIKDADGIGEVGNPTCLLPDEKIHKNSENISISDLKKEQMVLTHSGNHEKINIATSRYYGGKIIKLKNKLGEVNLTPEHLVYAAIIPNKTRFRRNKHKRDIVPSWHHSENLKTGDIVLYPILKKQEDINFLDINIPKLKWDFKSIDIPNKIPLNSDLLRLFGYFISEGNIQDKPCKTYISFALNINERDIVEDIREISKKLFGLDIKIKERREKNGAIVYLYNAKIARWFKDLFGNGAEHKKLPDFIMNLPVEKQKSLIYGLWKGDGYINPNRKAPRGGYATISYQLAHQMKTLLLRQKIVPSIYEEKERKIRGVNHKKSYRIHVGQRDSLLRLCKLLGVSYSPKSYENIKSWFDDNYLYTPITGKEILDYSGRVINLEVENSHSFVSQAFCLHNCGDILTLYIKVAKRKLKGKVCKENRRCSCEEYIKEIKFNTLGCAAAIAVSSMITQMAKGKTLDEAEKITNNDIVKELDGVPPVKYHCSLLGAEALHLAIKDYRNKSEGKGK